MNIHDANHRMVPNTTARARVLAINRITESEVQSRVLDIAALDLSDPDNWSEASILLQGKFLSWLEDKFAADSRDFEQGTIAAEKARWLMDEFMIEQAAAIGLRVIFFPTALLRIGQWTQNPDLGRELWRRFAKNIQNGFDSKLVVLSDKRIPAVRDELIADLKKLRCLVREKKAASVSWNRELHVSNVKTALKNFSGEALRHNERTFIEFIRSNQDLFRRWLSKDRERVTDAIFANEFIAFANRYSSGESARQAIQEIKRRRTPNRKKT